MDRDETTELNPPKDTLSTNNTGGWIESAGSIGGEVEVITNNLNKSVDNVRQPH